MDPSARIDALARRQRGRARDPLRAIAADAATKGGRLRGPIEVTVEVTRDCAGACAFCVQATRDDPRHMEVDRFAGLVRELAAASVARLRLTGGEPSAHPRLVELVALAKALDLSLIVETDASAWSTPVLAALSDLLDPRCDRLQISVDALSPAIHQRLRSTPARLPWALLDAATRAGITCESHTLVLGPNLGEVAPLVERLLSLGVARAIVTLPHGRELDPALRPDAAATLDLFAMLSERSRVRLSLSPLARALADVGLVPDALATRYSGPCHAGQSACFVDVDGGVSLCALSSEPLRAGLPLPTEPRPFATAWAQLSGRAAALSCDAARCPARAAGLISLGQGSA